MNENTGEQIFYTVTYHDTERTSGELPVDTKKYKPPVRNPLNFKLEFIEKTKVLDTGTMKKEDYVFSRWKMRHRDYTESEPKWHTENYYPGHEITVSENIDFDSEWVLENP